MNADFDSVDESVSAFIKENATKKLRNSSGGFDSEEFKNKILFFVNSLENNKESEIDELLEEILEDISNSVINSVAIFHIFEDYLIFNAFFSILQNSDFSNDIKNKVAKIIFCISSFSSFNEKFDDSFFNLIASQLNSFADDTRAIIYDTLLIILKKISISDEVSSNLCAAISSCQITEQSINIFLIISENHPIEDPILDIICDFSKECPYHQFILSPVPFLALSFCISKRNEIIKELLNGRLEKLLGAPQSYDKDVTYAKLSFLNILIETDYSEYAVQLTNWTNIMQSEMGIKSVKCLTSLVLNIEEKHPEMIDLLIDCGLINNLSYFASHCLQEENNISLRYEVIRALSILLPVLPETATTVAINAGLSYSIVQLLFSNPTKEAFRVLISLVERVKKENKETAEKLLKILDNEGNFDDILEDCEEEEVEEMFALAKKAVEDLRNFVSPPIFPPTWKSWKQVPL